MRLVLFFLLCACAALGRDHHRSAPAQRAAAAAALPQPDAAEFTAQYWYDDARAALEKRARLAASRGKARNVVMFLGDGMSVPTLAAARTLLGQRRQRPGEEAELYFESFPTVGLAKTYCLDAQIADSACTATAYLCGVKNNEATLGVSGAVLRHDCDAANDADNHVDSIAAWALEDGRDAGIVTTTRVTHASPAGAYSHSAHRDYECDADVAAQGHDTARCADIAQQLIHSYPGNKFKVILGGGRREFLPNNVTDEEGSPGRRTDDRDLIEEWQNQKRAAGASYSYVWNRDQLMSISNSPPDYLLGLFESSHLEYNLRANKTTEPTLAELTEVAIRSLARNDKGFFLFVEGGRIDHAHHDNLVHASLDETIELAAAVERAAELLDEEDSLLVVTADHAHVMAFNGYTWRGTNILGVSDERGDDGVPFMTLSYTNGPGARPQQDGVRVDFTNDDDFMGVEWPSHAEVPLEDETHGGDDVAVFARGPHHEAFTGLYEQSQVAHRMAFAACIGPGKHACNAAPTLLVTATAPLLLFYIMLLKLLG